MPEAALFIFREVTEVGVQSDLLVVRVTHVSSFRLGENT
jgi:hypothetical protein